MFSGSKRGDQQFTTEEDALFIDYMCKCCMNTKYTVDTHVAPSTAYPERYAPLTLKTCNFTLSQTSMKLVETLLTFAQVPRQMSESIKAMIRKGQRESRLGRNLDRLREL
jgi:hypothetical protein